MSQELVLVMRRCVSSRGGWQPILQRLSFGLYATDQHGWKLCRCLLSALGTDADVQISRVCAMSLRSGGAHESQGSHDLHAAHELPEKNRHVYGCTL